MYVMSGLRRIACGTCPPPIEKPSPSPPAHSTSRSGLAILMPCAMGSDRPCTVLKPYAVV
jgi:hypothetical protein